MFSGVFHKVWSVYFDLIIYDKSLFNAAQSLCSQPENIKDVNG